MGRWLLKAIIFVAIAVGLSFIAPAVSGLICSLRSHIVRKRAKMWNRADATVVDCEVGDIEDGLQEFQCTYTFSVDDVRQAGSFTTWIEVGRASEVKDELIGRSITALYNPRDYAQSILEQQRIGGWQLLQ